MACSFCHQNLDPQGHHIMTCMGHGHKQLMHTSFRNVVYRLAQRTRTQPKLEPIGLLPNNPQQWPSWHLNHCPPRYPYFILGKISPTCIRLCHYQSVSATNPTDCEFFPLSEWNSICWFKMQISWYEITMGTTTYRIWTINYGIVRGDDWRNSNFASIIIWDYRSA